MPLRVAAVVVLGGVAAGVIGMVMAVALIGAQWLTFGVASPALIDDVTQAPLWRRVLGPTLAGALVGLCWWWLRRARPEPGLETTIERPGGMDLGTSFADAMLQIAIVGSGASIGREGAPRLAAGAVADRLARWCRVPSHQAGALVAAAAGAGLAAVYNVPVAGVVFAVEILLRWRRLPVALAAAVPISAIATVTAWPVVTARPTYALAPLAFSPWLLLVAALAVPVTGLLGWGFGALCSTSTRHRTQATWRLPVALAAAGAALGVASGWLPMLPGNGKDMTQLALDGSVTLGLFATLLVVKPLATAMFLRAGATGGLLTPAIALGAAAGVVAALVVARTGGSADVATWALLGGAGVLAVTQRAPLFGAVMMAELTHAPLWLLPLLLVVSYGSDVVSRALDGRIRRRCPTAEAARPTGTTP